MYIHVCRQNLRRLPMAYGLNAEFNPKREKGIHSHLNLSRGARPVAAAWFRG